MPHLLAIGVLLFVQLLLLLEPMHAVQSYNIMQLTLIAIVFYLFLLLHLLTDLPTQVPPLTPGTTQKMTQALTASFSSFEKDRDFLSIPRGMYNSSCSVFNICTVISLAASVVHYSLLRSTFVCLGAHCSCLSRRRAHPLLLPSSL